jgi:CheY-like chemotaxis protein
MMPEIRSILLVDDESLFHLVFEDACSILDISLGMESIDSANKAEDLFRKWAVDPTGRPECVFVDLNLIGSSFDGIELVRRINTTYGNGVVIGIISSSSDPQEIKKAQAVGAQFWIVKSDNIEPRLERFREKFGQYKSHTAPFELYE